MAQAPLDADRARAGTDIPEQFAGARRQRRQRDRPDIGLGELAVMLEPVVGQPGRQRQDTGVAAGDDLDRQQVERHDVIQREAVGAGLSDALVRAADRFQHGDRTLAEAARAHQLGHGERCRIVPGQGQDPCARLEKRDDPLKGTAVQRDQSAFLLRPAHPRAGHREGGELRDDAHLRCRHRLGQPGADAVMERVAGREHADIAALFGQDRRQRVAERLRPGPGFTRDIADQFEVALAAEDDLGALQRGQRFGAEPGAAILAEPDQR